MKFPSVSLGVTPDLQSWQVIIRRTRMSILFREISRRNPVDDWRRCWLIRVVEVKGFLGRAPLYRDRKLCPCIQVRQNGSTPRFPSRSFLYGRVPLFPRSSDTAKDKNVFEGFSNWKLRHAASADCICNPLTLS